GLADRVMALLRNIDAHCLPERLAAHSCHGYRGLRIACCGEAAQVRQRAATHEQPVSLRGVPNDLLDPLNRLALKVSGARRGAPRVHVWVERGGEQVGDSGDSSAGRGYIAEEARMSIVPIGRHDYLLHEFQ